jgi:hypothetical protein
MTQYQLEGENKNTIKLQDGRYIYFDHHKYGSKLNILVDSLDEFVMDNLLPNRELSEQFNLQGSGNAYYMPGRFFVSKKGSPFFDTTGDTPHVLCMIAWGGSFRKSRGLSVVPQEALYYKRRSSNGGGYGKDYIVLPKDFQNVLSLDDF